MHTSSSIQREGRQARGLREAKKCVQLKRTEVVPTIKCVNQKGYITSKSYSKFGRSVTFSRGEEKSRIGMHDHSAHVIQYRDNKNNLLTSQPTQKNGVSYSGLHLVQMDRMLTFVNPAIENDFQNFKSTSFHKHFLFMLLVILFLILFDAIQRVSSNGSEPF